MAPLVMKAILGVAALLLPHQVLAGSEETQPAPKKDFKSVSKGANKKIGMVVTTLQDILQSCVNEEKQETVMYDKYVNWCTTQTASLAKDLSETTTELANAKVLNEEQVSSIDSLTLLIQKNTKEIEETKDAIAQAVALRTDENGKYAEEAQINMQSLRQINLAIKSVSKVQKQGGFLQNGELKKLSLNQPGESNYVMGVMKGLLEKLTKNRDQLNKVEKEKVKMHNDFMSTKGQSLKALQDTTTGKKIELAGTTAKQAQSKKKIRKLSEEVASLTQGAAKTAETCQTTKTEWKVRQADRTKEKAALNEAIRFLKQTSLEQLSLADQGVDQNDEAHASVVFAPAFLQTDSVSDSVSNSKFADNAFFAAAAANLLGEDDEVETHVRKTGFTGVKAVVEKLIASHKDTQQEETTKKKYCKKEIADKDDEKSQTEVDLAAVSADIDKKTSESDTLVVEIKNLYAAIASVKTGLESATKIRKQENTLFVASSKDRALALKVLNQAKAVLQNFYDKKKGSLLQDDSDADQPKIPKSSRKKEASFGAVSMVQDIADDITKEQTDAATAEKEASTAFESLQVESRKKTDDKQQDITDRTMTKAKLGVQINTLKETKTQKSDDLTAVTKQLQGLHGECDELLKFFDKRVKGRNFEVSQLRDVMDILSGSSIAARTGLVQEDASAALSEEQAE